jgi:hypothetical protein
MSQWKRWVATDIYLDHFHTKYLRSIAYPNDWMTSLHYGFFDNIISTSTKTCIFVVSSIYKGYSTQLNFDTLLVFSSKLCISTTLY